MHQSDYVIEYGIRNEGDYLLQDPEAKPGSKEYKIVGNIAKAKIIKSATGESGGPPTIIPIKKGQVGNAIWAEREVADFLEAYELIKKEKPGGSWLKFDEAFVKEAKASGVTIKEKVNGKGQLYDYIESDRPVFEWLHSRFRKMLGQDES